MQIKLQCSIDSMFTCQSCLLAFFVHWLGMHTSFWTQTVVCLSVKHFLPFITFQFLVQMYFVLRIFLSYTKIYRMDIS